MSGQATRTRRRAAVGALAALMIALFGAAANADDSDPTRDGQRVAAPTTDDTEDTATTDDPSTSEPGVDLSSTPPGDPPGGLGDDAELDALAQSCFVGDLVACDHLFLQSPVGSAYEEYGDTCAGRQEAGTEAHCALGGPIEPTPPENLGTDPVLDALANDCYLGDMAACDELYDSSEQDSEYQIYGDTCAGRQPQNTGLLCTSLESPVPGTVPDTSVPETTTADTLPPDTSVPETTTVDTLPPDTSVPETTTVDTLPPDTSLPETTTVDTLPPDTSVPETSVITTDVPTSTPSLLPAPTEEPVGLGTDPALDAFAQACYDGDMAACDNLYNESEPDSEYRRYGDTCAGRQPEGTGVWCRTAFGDGPPSTNVTVPPPTVPPLTVPPLTVPPLTVPPLTAPPATVPPLTAPPITAPVVPTLPVIPTVPTTPGITVPGAIPPPTQQPTGLGTNATLDALALACYDGDMASCDELFRESDPELDLLYRDFGDTCAGRQPVGTGRWCEASFPGTGLPTTIPGTVVTVPGTAPIVTLPTTVVPGIPPATQQPAGLGNDPQLNVLAESCYNGDMQACDDLFLQSELGSTYHDYGDTCAGRQPTGTYTYCRVAFPAVQP